MAICATDVVAPMFAAPKIITFLFPRVTSQAGFGDLFRSLVLEGDDFCRIAFFSVGLAGTMTRLAPGYFVFPATNGCKFGVGCVRESLKLIFVAILACVTSNVV
jgi:hypothetical protein